MAEMIPNYIDQEDSKRNGERMVFNWFSNEEIVGTVYYSLLQKNHRHKLMGEVDFLYVGKRGILCIEVKGGQQIYCKDKQWHSVNRNGNIFEIKNPFNQAKDCMYALKKYLTDIYGYNSEQSKYLIGYAVVFPECKFTGLGNDLVNEVVFDTRFELDDFPLCINNIFDYWEQQITVKHGYTPVRLSERQQNQINDLLRGDFAVVPSFKLQSQYIEQQMIKLTDEQFELLDIADNNERVIIEGGAGTGKILLAFEKVRNCAAKEIKVLYLCYNKNMERFAKESLRNAQNDFIDITTYHSLIQRYVQSDTYEKTIIEISDLFIKTHPVVETYDYIVIDEAQDLMHLNVLEVLNHFIQGSLSNGSWLMFLDQNQNMFNNSEDFSFSFELLKEMSHPALFKLNKNCRNTSQIARRASVLTMVTPAKHLGIDGPKVVVKMSETQKDLAKLIRKEIASLLAGGISSKDIIILSTKKLENSILCKEKSMCNLPLIHQSSIHNIRDSCINYFTVQSFKGLESKIIFFVDVDGFFDLTNRTLNYVALSRAKQMLFIFSTRNLKMSMKIWLMKGRKYYN